MRPTPTPQPQAAGYVARSYLVNWLSGITRYYFYTWDNELNRFPLVAADGVTLTLAGTAYREIAQWLP